MQSFLTPHIRGAISHKACDPFAQERDESGKIQEDPEYHPEQPTSRSGGHLKRAFAEATMFDPFLLLDDFRSNDPRYLYQSFPWQSASRYRDHYLRHSRKCPSTGIVWATKARSPLECPVDDCRQRYHPSGNAEGDEAGHMGGFQLWANLPASSQMMEPR